MIVGGIGGGTYERRYCEAAVKIRSGDIKSADELFAQLSDLIPSDEEFVSAFAVARVPLSILARYYMYALDRRGEDRFRLVVHAGSSGDHGECMHLSNSCPSVEGTAMDPSFTGPALASFRLASAFARAFGPFLGWLNLVSVLEGLLTGEEGRAFLAREAQFTVAMVLERAAEGAARRLRALADAFDEVCLERAGLPPAVLLSFWDPEVATALQASEDWIQDLEADPGAREEFKARLDHAWTLGS